MKSTKEVSKKVQEISAMYGKELIKLDGTFDFDKFNYLMQIWNNINIWSEEKVE